MKRWMLKQLLRSKRLPGMKQAEKKSDVLKKAFGRAQDNLKDLEALERYREYLES